MPKPEWGVKRVCPTTGQRFYDLNKDPIISPYTGEEVKPVAKPESMEAKLRSQRADLERAKKAGKEDQEDLEDENELIDEADGEDADDTLIEDDDDDDDSPSLSDEDDDGDEPVEFDDDVLLDDDDDDDDAIEDIGDVKPKDEES